MYVSKIEQIICESVICEPAIILSNKLLLFLESNNSGLDPQQLGALFRAHREIEIIGNLQGVAYQEQHQAANEVLL